MGWAERTSSSLPEELPSCTWPRYSPMAGPAQPVAFLATPAHRVLPLAELQDAPEHQLLHAHPLALQIVGKDSYDAVQLFAEVHAFQHLQQHTWLLVLDLTVSLGKDSRPRGRQQGSCCQWPCSLQCSLLLQLLLTSTRKTMATISQE